MFANTQRPAAGAMRFRAGVLANLPVRALVLALFLASFAGSVCAEPAWRASIGVVQEYTDNVDEERDGKQDHITSLRPSLSYRRESSRLSLSADYSGDYRHYARGTNDEEFNHDLNARALLDAWESFLFMEATDTFRLVNEDVTEGNVSEGDATSELVQQNIFTFSPYIEPRFGERGKARIGYAFSNVWYEDEDKGGKDIHRGFVDTDYELTARSTLLAGFSSTREFSEDDTMDRHIVYVGGRYDYSEHGSAFLKIGPQYTRYRDMGESSISLFWDAGLEHDFGFVQLGVTSSISFQDDPETGDTYEFRYGTVRLDRSWERFSAGVSASLEDYEKTANGGSGKDTVRRITLRTELSYEFSARLTGTAGLVHEFEDSDGSPRLWRGSIGLDYALTESLNLSTWYRFKDSSSDDGDEDFRVNKVGLQLTYLF